LGKFGEHETVLGVYACACLEGMQEARKRQTKVWKIH